MDNVTVELERQIVKELERDDDAAARETLAAGMPIVYRETETPAGHVIRQYPDGNRELLRVVDGCAQLVGILPPV